MNHAEIILGALRRIERRLWARQAVREVAFGACVVLFGLVCFHLVNPVLQAETPAAARFIFAALLVALLVPVVASVGWYATRPVTPARAAGEADARVRLKDELKSACHFLSAGQLSPFSELQVARAARTAARLDPRKVVPGTMPPTLFAAAGLGLLLALTLWMMPRVLHSWDSNATAESGRQEIDDLRQALAEAPGNPELEKLDQALQVLRNPGASVEDRKRAAADAGDAIDQANMEAAAAREGLAKLAETMTSNPRLGKVAEALQRGHVDEAQALLEELRVRQAPEDGAGNAVEEEQFSSAETGREEEANLEKALEQAGRRLSGVNARVNQDTIDNVLQNLEKARERLEVQKNVNSVRRRMEDQLAAASQRSALTANQFGQRITAPNPTPSPGTGNTDLQGGTLFRQGAVARERGDDDTRDGARTGSASGESAALPVEGAATGRLQAQLKRETIQRRDEDEDSTKENGDWFYAASREHKSELGFAEAGERTRFARADAISREAVPVRRQQIVKDYFLKLHESEEK